MSNKQSCTYCGLMTPSLGLHLEVAHKKQEEERTQALAMAAAAAKAQNQAQRQLTATNNVIVIYEEVPESLKVYTLRVTNEELNLLQEAHNDFVDPGDRDESWVFKFLQNHHSAYDTNRADGAPVLDCGSNTIICTGVICDTTVEASIATALLGDSDEEDEEDDEFEESDTLDSDDSEEDDSDEG